MTKVEIKRLLPADLPLMRALLSTFGRAFDDLESYEGKQPSDAYLSSLLANPTFFALVALKDDTVIGGLAGYELQKFEQERSEFYIYDLAVEEAQRRQGIATALIGELQQLAKARGAWVTFVQADYDDPPAIALYEKLGSREEVLHFDIQVP